MPDTSSPSLSIRLFGPFAATVNGAPFARLRSRKTQWLLALLCLRPGVPVERAWLAGLLWPEGDEPRGLANLHKSVLDLRRALGSEAERLRAPTETTLCLNLDGADVDLLHFDAAAARGDRASLEEVVRLYQGAFLEECPEAWAIPEREKREEAFLAARQRLTSPDQAPEPPDHRAPLPRPIERLIGRETEVGQIQRLLAARRLVTLVGASGRGKTRLALEVAHDLEARQPGSVVWVELAALSDPRSLPSAVAAALAIQDLPGHPLVQTLADALQNREALLVLDPCEHLLVACAELVATLRDACPELRVLVTSRHALGVVGEQLFPVGPLSIPTDECPSSAAEPLPS